MDWTVTGNHLSRIGQKRSGDWFPHFNGDTVLAKGIQPTSHLEGALYQNWEPIPHGGPRWFVESDIVCDNISEMPDECALELRACQSKRVMGLLTTERISVSRILPENFSTLNWLRVTVNVLKFTYLIRSMEIDYHKLRTEIVKVQWYMIPTLRLGKGSWVYLLMTMVYGDVGGGCQMLACLMHPSILYYCTRSVTSQLSLWGALMREWGQRDTRRGTL